MLVNIGINVFVQYLNGFMGRLHREHWHLIFIQVLVVAQFVALLKTSRSVDTLRKVARSIRF